MSDGWYESTNNAWSMSIPWNEFVMIHIVKGIHSKFQRYINRAMFDNQQFDMICTCYVLYLFLWSNGRVLMCCWCFWLAVLVSTSNSKSPKKDRIGGSIPVWRQSCFSIQHVMPCEWNSESVEWMTWMTTGTYLLCRKYLYETIFRIYSDCST